MLRYLSFCIIPVNLEFIDQKNSLVICSHELCGKRVCIGLITQHPGSNFSCSKFHINIYVLKHWGHNSDCFSTTFKIIISSLVQVMAWCCQAPSHYLNQWWNDSLQCLSDDKVVSMLTFWWDCYCIGFMWRGELINRLCYLPYIWYRK